MATNFKNLLVDNRTNNCQFRTLYPLMYGMKLMYFHTHKKKKSEEIHSQQIHTSGSFKLSFSDLGRYCQIIEINKKN